MSGKGMIPSELIEILTPFFHRRNHGHTFTPGYWTSTDWDGDAKAFDSSAIIDLSAVFGLPAGIKAVSILGVAKDETVGVTCGFVKEIGAALNGVSQETQVANNFIYSAGIVPCDANGNIAFIQSGELDSVYLNITGYWS